MVNRISFPGLSIGPFDIDRVAFTVFSKNIYWYGIIIAVGFILGVMLANKYANKFSLCSDNVFDIVIYATPVSIICARIYYVIFNFSEYKDNLWDIFKIYNGGIAIYGAIIGAAITVYIYCKKKKINTWDAFDMGSLGLIVGQAIGRWGNFVNAEAHGEVTDSLLRMTIESNGVIKTVHPTFLYESLWNIGVLILLLFVTKRKKFSGQVFLTYVMGYGFGRFFIEGMRTDSLYLGNIRVSQMVALVSFAIALIVMIKKIKNNKKI